MSDLDIIRQIEKELDVKLEAVEELDRNFDNIFLNRKEYQLNKKQQVTKLGLSECGIKHLDQIIQPLASLKSLQTLLLDSNQISDISPLASLNSLQKLRLDHNQITNISALASHTSLQTLLLDNNQISDISPLASFKSLQILWLFNNTISDISPLALLNSLQELYLRNNRISDISALASLNLLLYLSIDHNQISDISPLASLKFLQELYLNSNRISDISPLTSLKLQQSLSLLNLAHNPIKTLPLWITDFTMKIEWDGNYSGKVGFITFFDNPLESPPPEIVKQGKEAIRQYLRSIEDASSKGEALVPLQEIKVHLIGDGLAGKTSLLKALIDIPFDPKESQTHGLNVVTRQAAHIKGLEQDVEIQACLFHFWDFGGQEIMHASHQFFMTSRSIYILVLDSRTDSNKHYWLRHIEKYGSKSPVIVVMNKIDENPSYNIEQNKINKEFPVIENRFHRTSCKNGDLDSLTKSLRTAVLNEHSIYGTLLAPSWITVKEKLVEETGAQRYISQTRFEELCAESNVTETGAQKTLLNYLNSLGIVLYFEKLDFADIYVLDPHWVTIGVYRIINSVRTADGHLNTADLDFILNHEAIRSDEYDPAKKKMIRYTRPEQRHLLDIMKQFELCYEASASHFIISSNLPKEIDPEPEIIKGKVLRFVMKYDYLPLTIIPRLMIAMQHDIINGMQWRYGMVLQSADHENARAKVSTDAKERTLTIEIEGEKVRKREYLSMIRHHIRSFNAEFSNLKIMEFIPLPDHPEICIEYEELLGYEKAGIDEYFVGKLGKKFSVSELLDSVISKEERNKESRMGDINIKLENIGNPTVQVDQQNRQQVEVNVHQEMAQYVQNLHGVFTNLKEDILREAELEMDDQKERKRLSSELDLAEKAIAEMETAVSEGKKELKPSVKERLGEFIDNLSNPDSRLRKGINLVSKGAEKASKFARFYNKCAPFFDLAKIPDGLLG